MAKQQQIPGAGLHSMFYEKDTMLTNTWLIISGDDLHFYKKITFTEFQDKENSNKNSVLGLQQCKGTSV